MATKIRRPCFRIVPMILGTASSIASSPAPCEAEWATIFQTANKWSNAWKAATARSPPRDKLKFLNGMRGDAKPSGLEAVALVTQNLLIDTEGNAALSPLTFEVQVRTFVRDSAGHPTGSLVKQYELNRRQLTHGLERGGLIEADDRTAVYLPSTGNDYSFASHQLQGDPEPVLVRLQTRCAACHGHAGVIVNTFSRHDRPPLPDVALLDPSRNEHGRYVVRRKIERNEFKALKERWVGLTSK